MQNRKGYRSTNKPGRANRCVPHGAAHGRNIDPGLNCRFRGLFLNVNGHTDGHTDGRTKARKLESIAGMLGNRA